MSRALAVAVLVAGSVQTASASERVVDVPTRPGVVDRVLVVAPDGPPKAALVLFAGGHGGLRIAPDGRLEWGARNFLVRARQVFADRGLLAAVVDAPSDRQREPFLDGFRTRREHVDDVRAVIAWLRRETHLPVWLVGTSRGTQSAAYAAVELAGSPDGPDGLVLTSTILWDRRDLAVPDLDLGKLRIPVLLVHHRDDGCRLCSHGDLWRAERKLSHASRREIVTVRGGNDEGDPCQALAHHGFNGQEAEVVDIVARFVLAP